MKKNYIASMISFTSIQIALITATQAAPSFPNLPRTCLPEEGRMVNDNTKPCHCPPVSMCNEIVNYKGAVHPKLPSFLKNTCCPPPPPPPAPPPAPPIPGVTINPPSKKCDVSYHQYWQTKKEITVIGSRVARFCSGYQSKTPNPSLNALNSCLSTSCKPIRNSVLALVGEVAPGASSDFAEYSQQNFQQYIQCRQNCFNTTGTNNFITNSENELNEWILLPLHDNASGTYRISEQQATMGYIRSTVPAAVLQALAPGLSDKNAISLYIARNDPPQFKAFTAKIYGTVFNGTINQLVWDKYFNNTYAPYKLGHSYPYSVTGNTDIYSNPGISSEHIQEGFDYFTRKIRAQGFKTLDQITTDSATPYTQPTIPVAGVTCGEYDDFTTCIYTEMAVGTTLTCLSPETKITLTDASTKAIKDLKSGDSIKAPYGKTAIIDEVVKLDWKELALYNINNGALRLTADHPIMTTEGWRAINYNARKDNKGYKRYGLNEVGVLKVGDIIVTEKGNVEITRIMPEAPLKDGITYNLKLKDNAKSFYANGILVKSHD